MCIRDRYKDSISDWSVVINILNHGQYGVHLFFVISGFILALPFAFSYIKNDKKIDIKNYYIRRLTRLEPPYIISLLLLFVILRALREYPIHVLLPHLLASLTYTHNLIYPGTLPLISPVAWSLEVEVQFYILAPFFSLVFKMPYITRRILIISISLLFILIQAYLKTPFRSLFDYIQYFAVGFLLADLYVSGHQCKLYKPVAKVLCLFSFILIWAYFTGKNSEPLIIILWHGTLLISIFAFYYFILFSDFWKAFFTNKIITSLGGMCYSIYLLHWAVISLVGALIVKNWSFSNYYWIDFIIYSCILSVLFIAISTTFYKLVEQPFMKKNWHLDLFNHFRILLRHIK